MSKARVIHRTKHDSGPRRKVKKLARHPAMKALCRMVEVGEVDRERTLDYLRRGQTP